MSRPQPKRPTPESVFAALSPECSHLHNVAGKQWCVHRHNETGRCELEKCPKMKGPR